MRRVIRKIVAPKKASRCCQRLASILTTLLKTSFQTGMTLILVG
jgi:hypothetical protein